MRARRGLSFVVGLCAAGALAPGCAGYRVYRVTSDATRADGPVLFYALPRAVTTVEVPVRMSARVPGRCARFPDLAATIGLPAAAVPTYATLKWSADTPVLGSRAEP